MPPSQTSIPEHRTLDHQLRQVLRECGLTQYQISQQSGVGRDQLSRFLSGETGLCSTTLNKLWHALNLRITTGPGRKPGRGANTPARGRRFETHPAGGVSVAPPAEETISDGS